MPDERVALLALSVLLFPATTEAQEAPAQILTAALRTENYVPGGLMMIKPKTAAGFSPIAGSVLTEQNAASLALDGVDPTTVYAGTYGRLANGDPGPCHVVALRIAKEKIVSIQRLNTRPLNEDFIRAVVPIGDQVFYLGRHTIGTLPKRSGPPVQLLRLEDWMDPRGMTSDGRFLYTAIGKQDIARVDLAAPTRFDLHSSVKEFGGEEIQNLAIDNEGDLLVVTSDATHRARLLKLDRITGKIERQMRLPLVGARAVDQDPVTGTIYVVGGIDANTSGALLIDDWKVTRGPLGRLPHALPAVLVLRPREIYKTGVACPDQSGKRAVIGSSGRASRQRSGFAITLQAAANRRAALLVGIEDPTFRPFDLRVLGAPGCEIGVVPFTVRLVGTNTKGEASIPFPRPPTMSVQAGVVLNAQWLVAAPKANAIDTISSRVARIIVRD